ncbi:uncharacterized protein RAG0_00180 [Rhynchosporium agropyri]|uniref:N-acetyltransferase domain-containing protein n=1 Tax=Rhynchosporium agropyri TaxID=914238 RepID=A0A1E1JRB7_9HELO|nr:uncharacterized protein RAG0_00180 [Rhynchosporium agropyri]
MSAESPPKILLQTPAPLDILGSCKLDLLQTRNPLLSREYSWTSSPSAPPDDARSCCMVLYSPEPRNRPVGTVRLVPSPHHPHPVEGARYEAPDADGLAISARELFLAPLPKYTIARSTSLHDGVKPFVKLGRLCVVEKYRGRQCAVWLV